ncbi:MAG TPA: globin, partial [Pseudolysinimonas sp.]|nr:globin [Pseudolysinimonas sp.]
MSDLTLRMGQGGEPVGGSFWQAVGGRATFEKLVRAFYAGVADDPVLLPMYPEQPDLEGAIQRLT